jgi:hypothetical protein
MARPLYIFISTEYPSNYNLRRFMVGNSVRNSLCVYSFSNTLHCFYFNQSRFQTNKNFYSKNQNEKK